MQNDPVLIADAGALIKDAKFNRTTNIYNWLTTAGMSGIAIRLLKWKWGGLWIGGKVTLYRDHLNFQPNSLNKAWTDGSLVVNIPLATVRDVTWRPGMRTGIIEVKWQNESVKVFSFRTERSKELANTIEKSVAELRGNTTPTAIG